MRENKNEILGVINDLLEIVDPRSPVADADQEERRELLKEEFDSSSARIFECVADDFGDRRRDAGLVLHVERQQGRDLPGSLPGRDDIGLVFQFQGEQDRLHGTTARPTTTVTSSRPLT